MARYLTPAKLGLLALIELYADGAVPSAATLPVLSFIGSHIIDNVPPTLPPGPDDRWLKADRAVRLVLSVNDFDAVLSPHSAAIDMPGRRLWDVFLGKLWGIDSVDALHTFFHDLGARLAKTKEELRRLAELGHEVPSGDTILLSRNSPFGTFVRRASLEFLRLRFHDVSSLWVELVKYRQPTADYWKRRHPSFQRLSFDSVLVASQHEWGDLTGNVVAVAYGDAFLPGGGPPPASTDDVELLLEFQVEQMQKYGNRVPVELRRHFATLLDNTSLRPSLAHYLSFLEAWRSGDYSTSFDCLHRYFDYTMENRDRLFYQYALMNLAVLQADFGCLKEAVAAMLETVSTARESRDNTCLNFALNWLFHFGRVHPRLVGELESNSMLGSGKESLGYLRVKARESGMWTLWISALLSDAKMGLSNGDSIATSLEFMARSSQVLVERNMKNMTGAQMTLSIAIWDRLGLARLSSMACDIFLKCHAQNAPSDDQLKTTCRLAGHLAGRGRYDEAIRRLEAIDANTLRSWKSNQYWQKYRGLLKLRRELHRNDLDATGFLLSDLLQGKPDDLEPDIAFVVDSLHVECLIRRGDLQAAFAKVEQLLLEHKEGENDISLRVRLLLIKAHLYDEAGRPQRGFSLAMRAASLSWRARLVPLLWQAVGSLANILTSLGEFAAAVRLLLPVIPRCLECEASFMVAQLYSWLADAHMGMAGAQLGGNSSGRADCMARAADALEQAFQYYAAVEDVERQCEMREKQATIAKASGEEELAEKYAAQYMAIRRGQLVGT